MGQPGNWTGMFADSHPSTAVARVGERFEGVREIAVLRGGGIGDLLMVLPAVEALAAAYPDARITLLGTPLHVRLLAGRLAEPHAVEVLPPSPGVMDAPSGGGRDIDEFFDAMRRRGFDLAVQLHGGGRNSNPFLMRLGAEHTVGTATPDATQLERTLPYAYYQHELVRALEIAGLAGAEPVSFEPRLPVLPGERESADALVDDGASGLLVVHPGATDPRRRWPVGRFARVAQRAAELGAQVIVVGDASDRETAADIVATARTALSGDDGERVTSVAGDLEVPELIGLLAAADVLVGNDSGPRHLAQAVGTATVAVYWFGNVVNAGPFGRGRHRVHISWTTQCPVCGRDSTQVGWTAERCEHDVSFLADVADEPVLEDVAALLDGERKVRSVAESVPIGTAVAP